MSRDDRSGEFIKETTLVKWKDLPRDAVKCTGERHAYCLDLVEKSQWYLDNHYRNLGQRDAGFNASDAYLYMQSNKLDNALAIKWNMISRTSPIKYAIIGLVILLVGYIVMLRVM